MGETAAGRWAAFEVGLIVPRQNGKGSILEALELAALFLADPDAPPPLILHSAHEFKTSAEHFRRVRDLIEATPLLAAGADHPYRCGRGVDRAGVRCAVAVRDPHRRLGSWVLALTSWSLTRRTT